MMHAPSDTLVDTTYFTIYDPSTRPWSFLGVELLMLACCALTLLHALRARRQGDGGALFAWVTTAVYGVCLEIASYNAFPTFTHGQFTVMFYHRKLPLYIWAFYPTINYSGQRIVRRLGLTRWAEPLVVGLVMTMMDVPFDILGPDAGWWQWDLHDPNVQYRWHGVPVTSYYWHLSWGAILAALCRWMEPRMTALAAPGSPLRFARLALAFPIAFATMALGRVAFLPFDLLIPLGVPAGAILVFGLVVAGALAIFSPRRPVAESGSDLVLFAIPCAFYGFHLVIAVAMAAHVTGWGQKMTAIAASTAFAAALNYAAQWRRATPSAARGMM